MHKKAFTLLCSFAAALVFQACNFALPETFIFKAKPEINIPIKINSHDFNEYMKETIGKAMQGQDMVILDYETFFACDKCDGKTASCKHNSHKNIQAFMVQFPIIRNFDIGIGSEILDIDSFKFELDATQLSQKFEIEGLGGLSNIQLPMDDMGIDLFDMIDSLSQAMTDIPFPNIPPISPFPVGTGYTPVPQLVTVPVTIPLSSVAEEIEFHSGTLEIKFSTTNAAGVNLTFSDFKIYYSGYEILYENPSVPGQAQPVTFNQLNGFEHPIEFKLAGKKLKDFEISFTLVADNSTQQNISLGIVPIGFKNIKLRGIKNASIPGTQVALGGTSFPIHMPTDQFIHAEIGDGTLAFNINMPKVPVANRGTNPASSPSWIDGFDIVTELKIMQNHSQDKYSTWWPGLNGNTIDAPIELPIPAAEPWLIGAGANSLNGKHINTEDIVLQSGSSIKMTAEDRVNDPTISFWLNDSDINARNLKISIDPELKIKKFAWAHVDIGDNALQVPQMEPVSLGSAAEYLKEIHLLRVGPVIEFDKVDVHGLELMISISELGINENKDYKKIVSGETIDFISDFKDSPEGKFVLNLAGPPPDYEIDIDFDLKIADNILAIKDLTLPEDDTPVELEFSVKNIDFVYDWSGARLDLSSIKGVSNYFPQEGETPIDMEMIQSFLHGFDYHAIEARLYLSGPSVLFKLHPSLDLWISYPEAGVTDDRVDLIDKPEALHEMHRSPGLNLDPNGTGSYSGAMPPNGMEVLIEELFSVKSNEIRFHYTISVADDTYIEREFFEGDHSQDLAEPINAEILVMIPLLLVAGPDGADIALPDFFEGKNDILDRDKSAVKLPVDFIKKLSVDIAFSDELLNGKFCIDDTDRADGKPGRKIEFPLNSNTLKLPVTKSDLEYINSTIPYKPKMSIFFEPGKRFQVVRNIGTIHVDFDAEIEYEIAKDDLIKILK